MDTLTRFILYISRKIILISVIAATLLMAFFIGYDCANMYVVVHDGLTERAAVVLKEGDPYDRMSDYFTSEYIINDSLLKSNDLEGLKVDKYTYQLRIESLWAWPWKTTATVKIHDRVENLEISSTEGEDANIQPTYYWENGVKELRLVKIDRSWRINSISIVSLDSIVEE